MESFVADDGERLRLHIAGSGTPLVLLHGWTASHAVWSPLMDRLTLRHRVFRPDARGHGGHGLTVSQTPDVLRLARDVENLLDHYGLEQAAVVGHSMGALTLWQYLRDQGCGRLSRLCIIDQSPRLTTDTAWRHGIYGDFDQGRSQTLLTDLEQDFPEAVLRLIAFGMNTKARDGYERNSIGWQQARHGLARLAPGPLIAIWKSLVAADYRDVLPGISVPTLLAWGGKSNFYTADAARFLQDRIIHSRLDWYPEADHCPFLLEPERFALALLAFLAGDAQAPGASYMG